MLTCYRKLQNISELIQGNKCIVHNFLIRYCQVFYSYGIILVTIIIQTNISRTKFYVIHIWCNIKEEMKFDFI